jgi:hypothetical protein
MLALVLGFGQTSHSSLEAFGEADVHFGNPSAKRARTLGGARSTIDSKLREKNSCETRETRVRRPHDGQVLPVSV